MDFPSNSNKDKEAGKETVARRVDPSARKKPPQKKPDKKIEKVVSGEVVRQKKPVGRRFKDLFFGEEFKSAMRYVGSDVLLPALQNLIVDSTSKGIERIIYGDNAPKNRSRVGGGQTRFSYNTPVNRGQARTANLPDQPSRYPQRRRHNVDDILLVSREEAETVVERLQDIIDNFDCASVADLYDLIGFPSSYVDNQWGWYFLNTVTIRQVREGYLIDLPPVEPI